MDRSLAIGMILAGCITHAVAGEAPGKVGVSGIEQGDLLAEVLEVMGTPSSKSRPADFVELVHHYDRFEVGYFESQVVHLSSTNPAHCTLQGLCPGDDNSRMVAIYGAPRIHPSRPDVAVYWQTGPGCWYEFAVTNGAVDSVGIGCQP